MNIQSIINQSNEFEAFVNGLKRVYNDEVVWAKERGEDKDINDVIKEEGYNWTFLIAACCDETDTEEFEAEDRFNEYRDKIKAEFNVDIGNKEFGQEILKHIAIMA